MLTCFSNLADHIFSLYQCSLNSSLMCLNPYMTWQGESYGQIASQHWALARFAALQISTKALTASSSNWRSAESCSLCFWFIASPCNSKWIGTIQAICYMVFLGLLECFHSREWILETQVQVLSSNSWPISQRNREEAVARQIFHNQGPFGLYD